MCPLRKERGLAYDIFPGQSYKFRIDRIPPEPGKYILELGLISESLSWFSDRGIPPLKFIVYVASTVSPSSP